jgi:hypothetical protein
MPEHKYSPTDELFSSHQVVIVRTKVRNFGNSSTSSLPQLLLAADDGRRERCLIRILRFRPFLLEAPLPQLNAMRNNFHIDECRPIHHFEKPRLINMTNQ